MTSPTLVYDIKFNLKKRAWLIAVASVIFLFSLPIRAGIQFQEHAFNHTAPTEFIIQNVKSSLNAFFGGSDGLLTVLFFIMAIVMGLLAFSDSHKRKQVDFYHGLPVTKSHIFAVDFFSGLLCVVIPYLANLLISVIVALAMGLGSYLPLGTIFAGIGTHLLFFLMIYAFTVLASVLCGNIIVSGLIAICFMGIGPAAIGVFMGTRIAFQPTWCDTLTDWNAILGHSSPVARYFANAWGNSGIGILELILMLVITAGVILLAVSLFKRRPNESAGHALVFPKSRIIFKYPLTLLAAAAFGIMLHLVGDIYSDHFTWLYIGIILGGFIMAQTVEIIYNADFRAISRKLLPLAIVLAVYCGFCAVMQNDIFGYNTYMPERDEVASVELEMGDREHIAPYLIYGDDYHGWEAENDDNLIALKAICDNADGLNTDQLLRQRRVTGEEGIDAAMAIAAVYLELANSDDGKPHEETPAMNFATDGNLTIRYQLTNGREVTRQYNCWLPLSDFAEQMAVIYDDPTYHDGLYGLFDLDFANIRLGGVANFNTEYDWEYDSPLPMLFNADATRLLTAYEKELKGLTGAYLADNLPIGKMTFLFSYDTPPQVKNIEEVFAKTYVNYEYPIYAACTETLDILENDFGIVLAPMKLDDIFRVNLVKYTTGIDTAPMAVEDLRYEFEPTELTVEKDYQIEGNSTVSYEMPEDRDEIIRLLNASYSENAFLKNPLIAADGNRQLEIWYNSGDQYNGAYCEYRYFRLEK